jgi:NAD(P)-dependent dehydrogenase (short-subunit alcohol dehydrogenase family)
VRESSFLSWTITCCSSSRIREGCDGADCIQILDRNLNPFSLDDFDFVMNVNVRGTIDLVRQCLPHIAKTTPVGEDGERGIVIMVASSAAFDGQPGQGLSILNHACHHFADLYPSCVLGFQGSNCLPHSSHDQRSRSLRH